MDSFVSLVFYLAVFLASGTLLYAGGKMKKKVLVVFGLAIPILVAAFRYKVGIDYDNYAKIVEALAKMSPVEFITSVAGSIYEPATYVFSQFSYHLTGGSVLFFAIYATICVVPFYFGLKKLKPEMAWVGVVLYLLMFFAPSLNGMRQYAAIAVVFYATVSCYCVGVNEKKRRVLPKFVLLTLVATLLHSSSIAALLIVPIYYLSQRFAGKSTGQIIIYHVLLVAVIFGVAYIAVMNISNVPVFNRYEHYLGWAQDGEPMPSPNLIPKIFPIIIASIFLKRLIKLNKVNAFYYTLAFVALGTSMLGFIVPYGYRLSDFFLVFQIPLLINVVLMARPIGRRQIYLLILFAYGMVYFVYSSFWNNSHGIFPYQFIFQERDEIVATVLLPKNGDSPAIKRL